MNRIHLLVAVLVALMLGGCSASNVARPETGAVGEQQTILRTSNSMLGSRLAVADLKRRKVGDLLQVQATLENQWKFKLDFQYKFKWFDGSGFEVAPESQSWRQLVMPGRTQANVQAIAPNPSAESYEIWVTE